MNTITTSKAQCRDCYKCIRYCPVKAIGLNDGQAWVDKDKCILCGRCIGACPQKAKSMASQLNQLERYLESGESIVFSIAPSYLAATSLVSPWKLIAALKKLGPVSIEETALGAELIAKEYGRVYQAGERKTVISSCCPVVVNLVEKYYPSLIPDLAGLVSPMVAHCRAIKKKCGQNKKVIFLGPCLAKKAEPNWESPENSIDAVLTFEELVPWLRQKGIEPENLSDEFPDYASNQASIFPLKQGILKTAGIQDGLDSNIISISGIEECLDAFNDLEKGLIAPKFIEALACKGGCIGGPAIGNDLGIQARRQRLFYFSQTPRLQGESLKADNKGIWRTHSPILKKVLMPSESEIREVLKLTGKNGLEDETNCGGCGYSSCREKAIAVIQGMAEPEMCIPYMKEKAESFSNTVIDTTFNAVIVVNKEMIIQGFNPAANRMFNRKNIQSKGESLSTFIDPNDFIMVWENQDFQVDHLKSYEQYGMVTRQIIYPLPKYGVVIGIITDITDEEERKKKHDNMRQEALTRASRVIREQMRVVQNVAGLLGESTAETKATLLELIAIMDESEASNDEI